MRFISGFGSATAHGHAENFVAARGLCGRETSNQTNRNASAAPASMRQDVPDVGGPERKGTVDRFICFSPAVGVGGGGRGRTPIYLTHEKPTPQGGNHNFMKRHVGAVRRTPLIHTNNGHVSRLFRGLNASVSGCFSLFGKCLSLIWRHGSVTGSGRNHTGV